VIAADTGVPDSEPNASLRAGNTIYDFVDLKAPSGLADQDAAVKPAFAFNP
jgi:hypothetical protein